MLEYFPRDTAEGEVEPMLHEKGQHVGNGESGG